MSRDTEDLFRRSGGTEPGSCDERVAVHRGSVGLDL